MTTTAQKIEALEKDLKFLSRVLGDLQTDDYEATSAMERTIDAMQATILDMELDGEASTEDELLAA